MGTSAEQPAAGAPPAALLRPPQRRRSWLHHGGFPPTQQEAGGDGEGTGDPLGPGRASSTHDQQQQGLVLHPHVHPTPQALAVTPAQAPYLQYLPHPPPACVTCGRVPCPTCGHGRLPHAGAAGTAASLQDSGDGGLGRGALTGPPYVLTHLHAAGAGPHPGWDPQVSSAHAANACTLLQPHSHPSGSSLLPLLGVRGRGGARAGTGRGGIGAEPPPQWQPEGRSSMPRGIRTMSLANRYTPRQPHLDNNSIPVANFGEGYGIWG